MAYTLYGVSLNEITQFMAAKRDKYGVMWDSSIDDLQVEFEFIRVGGRKTLKSGKVVGEGLFHHYRAAQSLCWPEDDHHRWSDLMLKSMVEHDINIFLGAGDTGKTWT